jgi:hypothetical protein
VTIEARCYGFARRYRPFLVNTVVGFIGPEYLEDGPQITRAALEDHFMGKLLGLPMGCDACFTYHARMSQDELESLKVLLGAAGCTYLMSLPVGDDIMLNYQSTSFHDIPSVRGSWASAPRPSSTRGARPRAGPPGRRRSDAAADRLPPVVAPPARVYVAPGRAADARRGRAHTTALLGIGHVGTRYATDVVLQFQAELAVAHEAVAAELTDGWAKDHGFLPLQTRVADHREYLLRPDLGRRLAPASLARLQAEAPKGVDVQVILADGLSALACMQAGPALYEATVAALRARGLTVGSAGVREVRAGVARGRDRRRGRGQGRDHPARRAPRAGHRRRPVGVPGPRAGAGQDRRRPQHDVQPARARHAGRRGRAAPGGAGPRDDPAGRERRRARPGQVDAVIERGYRAPQVRQRLVERGGTR